MPAKRRDQREQEVATSERLLDTAERLFAEFGFDGVGMRALADEAGVNLGATTYHYGSKEKLYVETFMRRFRPTNAARLEMLQRAEKLAEGRPLAVETIVECMLRPPFMTVLKYPNFPGLLARNLFMPPAFLRAELEKEQGMALQIFAVALAKALPQLDPQILQLRLIFGGGSLLMVAGQMTRLGLRESPTHCEATLGALIQFISAGLRAESPTIPGLELPKFTAPRSRRH
ncbi:MAG: TetR/AcrR family transcriptional regulator [Verrucomicrobia bacterium]|nr:TetR/AcrR family transcriptional regulator [Verrucomicrobiota bacterium]